MARQWSRFSPEEIERRRSLSVEAAKNLELEAIEKRRQMEADKLYWRIGQCCAGCDHWKSDHSIYGQCTAASIVSGENVLKSMGITFSTYTPPPGFPYTTEEFHCGKFADAFDWSTLDDDYLERIGAMRNGKLRPKPGPSPVLERN